MPTLFDLCVSLTPCFVVSMLACSSKRCQHACRLTHRDKSVCVMETLWLWWVTDRNRGLWVSSKAAGAYQQTHSSRWTLRSRLDTSEKRCVTNGRCCRVLWPSHCLFSTQSHHRVQSWSVKRNCSNYWHKSINRSVQTTIRLTEPQEVPVPSDQHSCWRIKTWCHFCLMNHLNIKCILLLSFMIWSDGTQTSEKPAAKWTWLSDTSLNKLYFYTLYHAI